MKNKLNLAVFGEVLENFFEDTDPKSFHPQKEKIRQIIQELNHEDLIDTAKIFMKKKLRLDLKMFVNARKAKAVCCFFVDKISRVSYEKKEKGVQFIAKFQEILGTSEETGILEPLKQSLVKKYNVTVPESVTN